MVHLIVGLGRIGKKKPKPALQRTTACWRPAKSHAEKIGAGPVKIKVKTKENTIVETAAVIEHVFMIDTFSISFSQFLFQFLQAAASCTTGLSDDGSQKEHTEPPAPAPATAPHNGDHESATGNVEDPGKIRRLRRLTRRSSVRTFQKGPK